MSSIAKYTSFFLVFLSICKAPLVFGDIQVSGSLTRIGLGIQAQSYEGSIELHNIGKNAEEVRVYQKDYRFFADGQALYEEPGANDRSNAPWIEFSPNILSIPAGGTAEIGYHVEVPDDDELNGTYWSLLFIESVPDKTDTPGSQDKFTLNIRQVIRYGIQLVTEIGETGTIQLGFVNPSLIEEDNRYSLAIDIENTGTVWLRPEFSCRVFDLSGIELDVIHGGEKRLYPGTSTRAIFKFPFLKAGTYKALVLADGGGENLFGANYTLKIED